ncbi:MAG TPA: SH3 domain-containing protein [Leucothrix sp.]|nr:SH3 domain-containing protein [Leucothrix sp.]
MYKVSLLTSLILIFSSIGMAHASPQGNVGVYKVNNVRSPGVLNVRSQPSSHSKILLQLPSDSRWLLKRAARQGQWQKVIWGEKEGWVHTKYISFDQEGSSFLKNHRQCMKSNPSKAICCGYVSHGRNVTEIKAYKVVNVPKGQSLNVRTSASSSAKKLTTMPHNAVGIIKHPRGRMQIGQSTWQKIHWNGRDGWVNAHFIAYDSKTSRYRNFVQNTCAQNN